MIRQLLVGGVVLALSFVVFAGLARAPTTTGRTIHVDCANTTGVEDGTPEHPYDTIQEGIDAAFDGDTVLVRPCTYYENIDFLGKAITVSSTDPLDPAVVETTVIDGGGLGPVVRFRSGQGEGSVLTGVTISNGRSYRGILCIESSPRITHNVVTGNGALFGGGICCLRSHAYIAKNTVSGNFASAEGAGIYCEDSSPHIDDNVIAGNTAGYDGGGIYSVSSSPHITGNTITHNVGDSGYGGGILICGRDPSPLVRGNTIVANTAFEGGGLCCCGPHSSLAILRNVIAGNSADFAGGMSCVFCSPIISSTIIAGNSARYSCGGGIACYESSPIIHNCTISHNTARYGDGIWLDRSSSPVVCDSIIWNRILLSRDSSMAATYSDTLDCWPGLGNICVDPQFVDPANGDYHLLPTSPCIDMGANDCVAPDDLDIDGEPRIWPPGGVVDMGADEVVCYCDVAIDRTHCKMPAAGHVGQCKTGHIGAKNMSPTDPCDVVMRVTDNAGVVVFESQPTTIGPGQRLRLRFEHCYTADEIGRNLWTWEVWPVECKELTPWNNVRWRRVNVQPGTRSSRVDWLPPWRLWRR